MRSDLLCMKLRVVLLKFIEQADSEGRELAVRLLLRQGLIRGSAEELLISAQLSQKFRVDISSEIESFCKDSEVYKKPITDTSLNFDRYDVETV